MVFNYLLKNFRSIHKRISLLKKIDSLEINKSGKDDKGFFVELKNGLIFYGPPSRKKIYKYYNFLSKNSKKSIIPECLNIAFDIVIRYVERGLKLGGPPKELYYTPKESDVVAEMGAFMGYYTMYLSQMVGKSGRIVAIEPIEDNLYYLRTNIRQNNLENVIIVPKGVWNKPERMTFFKKEADNQSASLVLSDGEKNKLEFEVDCLDNIFLDINADSVDFMLIQLNGAEYEALEGLTKTKPKHLSIAARYNSGKEKTSKKIKELLEVRGYKVKIEKNDYLYAELS